MAAEAKRSRTAVAAVLFGVMLLVGCSGHGKDTSPPRSIRVTGSYDGGPYIGRLHLTKGGAFTLRGGGLPVAGRYRVSGRKLVLRVGNRSAEGRISLEGRTARTIVFPRELRLAHVYGFSSTMIITLEPPSPGEAAATLPLSRFRTDAVVRRAAEILGESPTSLDRFASQLVVTKANDGQRWTMWAVDPDQTRSRRFVQAFARAFDEVEAAAGNPAVQVTVGALGVQVAPVYFRFERPDD